MIVTQTLPRTGWKSLGLARIGNNRHGRTSKPRLGIVRRTLHGVKSVGKHMIVVMRVDIGSGKQNGKLMIGHLVPRNVSLIVSDQIHLHLQVFHLAHSSLLILVKKLVVTTNVSRSRPGNVVERFALVVVLCLREQQQLASFQLVMHSP